MQNTNSNQDKPDYSRLLELIPDSEKCTRTITNPDGTTGEEVMISEYGVYLLCELAGTPKAKRFADYVEQVIMPTLRAKTETK